MSKKVALVLGGGGSRGSFQAAAEKYCREKLGYRWDVVAGISVGALNGCMLAMGKNARLWEIWRTVTEKDVYSGKVDLASGKIGLKSIMRLVRGGKSVLGNAALFEIIMNEVNPAAFQVDFRLGAVSLESGEYFGASPSSLDFKKAILASTSVPILWPPVDSVGRHREAVDGGIRHVVPIHDVLDTEPDEIVCITCFDRVIPKAHPSRNIFDVGSRSMYIFTYQICASDVNEFLLVNELARQAAEAGVTLRHDDGRPYRHIKFTLIEPDESVEPLHDVIDFSRKSLNRAMERGWAAAAKAFNQTLESSSPPVL